ncbi:topoisomerase DNA-binding C4 zinc finger domain-containing protein [Mesorhizobium sp. M0050]|uniref:helix-hairpin-helix domain-containing protein n=1 Tax=Mesorhizobium sp. M0050 TaxID=2956861 RepID=UPI00333E09A3
MKLDRLFADGQELTINKKIGHGGEGEVFSIANVPGYAVKAYLPKVVKEREGKIRAMVSSKLAATASTIAFPYQIVTNAKGEFVGFLMRLVEKHKEIHELQTPSSRQKHFPNADYRFLVRTAVNIARVFAQAHVAGCIVGDSNQRGILVSQTATVALIDADSFQVTQGGNRYLCVVGVPEYTPPELQGKTLATIVRTPDHDAFGLAVSLFQVLCMDRHPFSGRYAGSGDMPLEKAIAEYRFAYSSRPTGMSPPPGTVRLNDFTPAIRDCFEQAFSPQYVGRRPSPARWVAALEELEASLRVCFRNRLHHYSRLAPDCPWCRMEAEYGRPLFISQEIFAIHLPNGRVDEKQGLVLDVQALLTAVNGIPIPTAISVPVPITPYIAQAGQPAIDAKRRQRVAPIQRGLGVAAILAAGIAFLGYQLPFIIAGAIVAGGGWLIMREVDPGVSVTQAHGAAVANIKKRVEDLQSLSPIDRVLSKKAEALDAIDEYKALSNSYSRVVPEYDQRRRQQQLDVHLSNHPIRGARIGKVSSIDIASLTSYGIANALEARKRDVQQVHGIGPVKAANIAAWVKRVESHFHFRQEYSQDDKNNIKKLQSDIISKQQGVDDKFKRLVEEGRKEARAFEDWKKRTDPELGRLMGRLGQTEADLRYLGLPVPSLDRIAPFTVPPVESYRSRRSTAASFPPSQPAWTPPGVRNTAPKPSPRPRAQACPRCGSRMIVRTARQGRNAGNQFWGCSRYPSCTGTRPI